ncbi:hypothetical protein SLE2022_059500 [Rubroshorea leprosula]
MAGALKTTNGKGKQDLLSIFSIILLLVTLVDSQQFNVMNYKATGNGQSDDFQAFLKAWDAVCGSTRKNPTLIIPENKMFLLSPITFEGPCKSNVAVQFMGAIVAPGRSAPSWKSQSRSWILFANVTGLQVTGKGKLDARGSEWWEWCPRVSSCSKPVKCKRPTTLRFLNCSSLHVSGLTSVDSGQNHISIHSCHHGTFRYITLIAPDESPNTDGIDISNSNNIEISKSNIRTGDDCIAINGSSSYINITELTCGPGHGISVGSLGKNRTKAEVEEIHVKNCTFNGTQNGARIKTWQGGSGYARKISFEKIQLFDSGNPIIIDQYYCDCKGEKKCENQTAAVQISDITFRDIQGTSNKTNVIKLSCSETLGCTNILVENVNLTSTAESKEAYSSCVNAHGRSSQSIPPIDCLLR